MPSSPGEAFLGMNAACEQSQTNDDAAAFWLHMHLQHSLHRKHCTSWCNLKHSEHGQAVLGKQFSFCLKTFAGLLPKEK